MADTPEKRLNSVVAQLWKKIINEWEGGSFLWSSANCREFRGWEPSFAQAVAQRMALIAHPFVIELIQSPEGPALIVKN